MKKIIPLLFFSSLLFGQNSGKIADKIERLQKTNSKFEKYLLFNANASSDADNYSHIVDNANVVKLNFNVVKEIKEEKHDNLEIEIPYNGKLLSILLFRVDVTAENFQVDTDKQKNITVEQGVFYRGIFKDDRNSVVSFNFFSNQMSAIMSDSTYGNLVIGKLETPNNLENYIIYQDSKLKILNSFSCATEDKAHNQESAQSLSVNSNRCATIYFEVDFSLFTANGSTANQTAIWMTSVYNNVQTLFQNDGISTALQSLFIWTTPDPYTGTSSLQNLNTFRQVRPVFNGDVGHLVAIDGGYGGLARAVDGVCNAFNFCYADVFFAFQNVPAYSWTVNVITHELGHLFGSQHTHGCFWNGNNTAIDGCGPTSNAAFAEGTCPTGPVPTPAQKGTIMSYCFLLNNIGINFANGFGPQPAARMLQKINSSNCLSTDCINTCISQISNLTLTNTTNSSFALSFTDGNAANTQWQYSVTAYPFTNPVWININATNFTTNNNLTPNTYYKVCVRPICPAGVVAVPTCITTATTDAFCSVRPFTDTGGLVNSYQDNESWTRTVIANDAMSTIRVVFSSIDIEAGYDFLNIYNGLTTASTNLTPGGISGNVTPTTQFVGNNPARALTFKFDSDGNTVGGGWNALFSCSTLSVNDPTYIDFSYFPNPVKNELTINSKDEIQNISIYTIEGKTIYFNNKKLLSSTISMQDFAKGTYIVRLELESQAVSFKVMKE